jgi:acyl-CoA reductase-like NAD-dependent aldehyde dehydrogenase
MPGRLDVLKTYKLYIDGQFPRSESGRSFPVTDTKGSVLGHVAKASRKDLRDAVEAARKAQPGWAASTAYLRGQIMYRMAEMLEGKRAEFAAALGGQPGRGGSSKRPKSPDEVAAAIDRLVHYAGWADKYAQVLGCNNPVSGPYYNFTITEPTGVVAVVAPDQAPLLALVSLIAPALCAGNTVVAVGSHANPLPAAILGEVCATSDVPAGVVNILTGDRAELLPHIANHRDIDAINAANLDAEQSTLLRAGIAENLKRVTVRGGGDAKKASRQQGTKTSRAERIDWFDNDQCQSPWWIEPFVEMKTIWHPASV